MNKRKSILAVVALVCVVALMAGVYLLTRPETTAGGKHITVTVVHSDDTTRVWDMTTQAEYLGEVLVSEGIVEASYGDFGLFFDTADGETADWNTDQSYWSILIGQEYATTGADGIALTDGGEYALVYTRG